MSENRKHTDGDWQAERSQGAGGYFEWFVRRDGDAVAIASDITDPETGQPSEANAVLMAAAPRLLEALEKIARIYEDPEPTSMHDLTFRAYDMRCIARAAIAKAKP
jgi:hypothetical protein